MPDSTGRYSNLELAKLEAESKEYMLQRAMDKVKEAKDAVVKATEEQRAALLALTEAYVKVNRLENIESAKFFKGEEA
jgi:hypothetical protein